MRSARAPFMALTLALAALTPPSSGTVHAGPVPDTTGILTPWHIVPKSPCVNDSVLMVVRGFVATPCDSFIGAEAITRFLESRGRAGVPLYLWYRPGKAEPEELPQVLTPSMLSERALQP